MKSIMAFIVFISSLHSFTATAQAVNDLTEQKLNGKVKSLTEYCYQAKKVHGKQQSLFVSKSAYTYNEHGNKTMEYVYNTDGTLDSKSVFNYDNNDQLIQEDSYNPDGSAGFTNIYKYDKRGNMTSVKLYDTHGSLFLTTTSTYDVNNNEAEEVNYTQIQVGEKDKYKDIVLSRTLWRYDDKNNKTEEQYYERDTTMTRHTYYKYDGNGNKTEQDKTESGTMLKTTYKYDSKGNVAEETQYDAAGSISARIVTTYDDKGNELQENNYDRDNYLQSQTTFQIIYDQNGNWTRKVETDNDKSQIITLRTIVYY